MRTLTDLGRFAAFSTLFLLLGHGLSVRNLLAPPPEPRLDLVLAEVQQQFRTDLDALLLTVAEYAEAAAKGAPASTLQTLHLRSRLHFKRCEYLLEYIEPETVKRYLNGAPLPKIEPSVPEVVVIEPVGLQVLDELAFADSLDYGALGEQTRQLYRTLTKVIPYMQGHRLQHRHVFEAAREEVIRLFTLGVTGFDTPGSVAALPEALTSLERLEAVYIGYSTHVARRDAVLDETIRTAFREGRALLRGADFDTFDRLAFLQLTADPLIAALPRAQALLEIESVADDERLARPVNQLASSLFAADFLNAEYYDRLSDSPYEAERRALGESLFFDPVLSEDLRLSCANCHRPELAFTDGKPLSVRRNAPTLVNSVYAARYFYDLREEFLERQARHVVMDVHEFATDFGSIEARLRQSDTYRLLFDSAYADQPRYALSAWSVSDALAHYVSSLRGLDSAFDRYARGETAALEPAVRRGFNLFMGKAACGSCHFAPTFSGLVPPFYQENESEVLGVPAAVRWEGATVDPDPGRIASGRPEDEAYFHAFAFKTPTVRNVAVTAPYMHNGVYSTLAEVLDFYNRGGGKGIGVYLEHQTLPFDSLGLTAPEMADIVTFMESLTDYKQLDRRPAELPRFEQRVEWNGRQ
ncbi:cytochrome-c peroxidase [Neolewinella sp.]|uniref:cytochrome-c peroxidase n=1 Tax=Neolewinella sp. TaxID=2993543 RepID=UPI003B5255C6